MGSCVSGDKAYKGLPPFVRDQWHKQGEYREGKFVWVQADTCRPPHACTVLCAPATPHVTFDRLIIWATVTTAAFALRVFANTFRIHKQENKHVKEDGVVKDNERIFTAHRNARIASAVLATAIPSVRPSVTRQ